MKILNPHSVPLKSINLIEASAGTGKSWTVTFLYLRLILESHLTVDQILVVTFTDAATKELRDAVRHRLVEAQLVFDEPKENSERQNLLEEKPEYQTLLEAYATDEESLDEAVNRLKRAKLSIDEAAIFTIHSFCKRVLNEYAFESSLPFDSELMDDDRELMQQLTDDYWRRNFHKAPRALIYKLQQKSITPDSLLDDIWKHVGKPYLEIKGPVSEPLQNHDWKNLEAEFNKSRKLWEENADQITQLLLSHGGLHASIYSEEKLLILCQTMCECVSSLSRYMESGKGLEKLGDSLLIQKTKKGFEPPQHPFFSQWQTFIDRWQDVSSRSDDFINLIRVELLIHLQKELPKEKKRLGVLAYDDLLLQLQSALKNNVELAASLKFKYKAALIDEFQDTDPIQFDIFNTIFNSDFDDAELDSKELAESAVFLVGDPKQAIYSFRGGDINTYLKAKKSIPEENHYTINTNYRSHSKLIEAYNILYSHSDNPFQDDGIEYTEITAGNDNLKSLVAGAPLRFWKCNQEDDSEKLEDIKQRIASTIALEIAQYLNGKDLIEGHQVSGGDIAILVKSHKQGDIVKQALSEQGIASIQSSKKTIFETPEADELRHLLNAVIEPQQESSIRRALVTDLIGKKADDLLQYERDFSLWEEYLVNFQNWHFQWKKQGFLPMMMNLMQQTHMHQQLLSYSDGERRLTNVLHLSELIHQETRQHGLSMEEVLRWLKKQQKVASSKEGELRLESDDDLVKIVTIHKSKGLEYPIVYCPFVGLTSKAFSDKTFSFHEGNKSFLEIGSPDFNENKKHRVTEEKAEETRLLYVALTRAKYRCTVVCFPEGLKGVIDRSALGWLLSNGQIPVSGKTKRAVETREAFYKSYVTNIAKMALANKCVSTEDLPRIDTVDYEADEGDATLVARKFTTNIRQQAQVTSFSGLTASSHSSEHESPDYDVTAPLPVTVINQETDDFPRGATAGTALHEIYENIDFEVSIDDQQEIVENSLNKWGFNTKYIEAANTLMKNSLQAEIFTGFSLNQLSKESRLDEMEFYLPLERLDVKALRQILYKHLPSNWQVVRNAVESLNFEEVEGFLKGYIDLIFEHQGKYFIVDYKSNSLANYDSDVLLPVMAESHYYLQYLLYSVALHRYLKKRIMDYSWDSHMGGAYYLFIRGMHKMTKKGGGVLSNDNSGIFYDKPSYELISALDNLFMESFL